MANIHVKTPSFNKTTTYLTELSRITYPPIMDRYGRMGVRLLREATPRRSGKTANSWVYEVKKTSTGYSLNWRNTNLTTDGTPLVILLEFGHGKRNGGYIPGKYFVRPTLKPVMRKLHDAIQKELRP